MIQDIAPRHYDNAYHPTQPKAGDRVFFYHEGSTLLSAATGEPFTWEEVTDLTGGETLETTYFFRIDETAFHWSREVPQSVLEASLPVKDSPLPLHAARVAGLCRHHRQPAAPVVRKPPLLRPVRPEYGAR